MGSLRRAGARLIALAAVAMLAACGTPAERFERRASVLGFNSILLRGDGFDHRSYAVQAEKAGTTLHVYIEHDGTPWARVDSVSEDPTPRTAYALELMAKDSGPRLLLGRPCYFQEKTNPRCSPLAWTHERYSLEVVASMVAALRRYLSAHPFRHVVLVGYSGGGTLAWLMAARVPETTGLVTIAANLDIDQWARLHNYSALVGSLNPATAPALSPSVAERHYVGGRDVNVPPSVVRSFARRHPGASVIEIADFDHTCCWIEHWPRLLAGPDSAATSVTLIGATR
ncbi:MAG: alpha/beta fold hydrolase [Pseudomonadota bacterium]